MGPKAKKKGGGKKSKAKKSALQKQQQEEAEREAARLEKERLERERMEKLEAKYQEQKESELAELNSLEQKFLSAQHWKVDYRVYAKWEHYLSCDGIPDPTVLQEINTFMSLWREDQDEDVELVMEKGAQVLNLIENLQLLLMEAPPNGMTEKEAIQYQESILELQNLLHHKYNEATQNLLKIASMYEDPETGNMQTVIKDKNVTFCIWVNLKKKVRFKNHVFSDAQHGFDLPKSLALSSVAVRILHTRYDHVSPLWLYCQGLPDLEAVESKILTEHPKDSAEEPQEEEKEGREEPSVPAEEPSMPAEEPSVPAEEETYPEGRKGSGVSLKETSNNNVDDVNETGEETEKKSEILEGSSQEGDPAMQEKTRHRAEPVEPENVDLQQFVPVGGVFHIDALQIPPQVIEVRDWSMVELQDTGLETFPYCSEEAEDATESAIQITLGLPENVVYFDSPVVAWWDPAGQQWRTDSISNTTYKTEEQSITFELHAFYTVALLQDAHLNMPYKAWELQPTGLDEAVLRVTTIHATIEIQIKDKQCMLSSVVVEEKDVLSHITGQWMSPLALRAALKRGGVNIFPGEYSHNYVPVPRKAALAEGKAYQQMALLASAFAFASSKWNGAAGPEHVVFQVSEHLEADSVKDNWSLFMFNGQKAQKLKITEASEAFSEEVEEDSELHSSLYHLLKDFASKGAMDRVEGASFLFTDVVYQLLLAIRVLTYS